MIISNEGIIPYRNLTGSALALKLSLIGSHKSIFHNDMSNIMPIENVSERAKKLNCLRFVLSVFVQKHPELVRRS